MNADDQLKLQVEAWKTTVQVQQHFNDIGMRIRALAITVLTAVLSAAAVAIKNGTTLHLLGSAIPLGSALLFIGLVTWILFYGVDGEWYHRLLIGSVLHGQALEDILNAQVPGFGLTRAISKASPVQMRLPIIGDFGKPVRSTRRLRIFYAVVAVLLVLAVVLSAFGK